MSSLSLSEAQSTAQYIHRFLDLVDNVPNELSRHLTQLHALNNNYLKLINRMDTNVDNYNQLITRLLRSGPEMDTKCINDKNNQSIDVLLERKQRLSHKIETQLIQMQELSDEKLKYSQLIIDLIEIKAKELDLDFEEVLHFDSRRTNNSSDISLNNNNNKLSANQLNAKFANGSHESTTSADYFESKENEKQREAKEENTSHRLADKRLLPRRACALKSGHTLESSDETNTTTNRSNRNNTAANGTVGTNAAKGTQSKAFKSKSKPYSRSHKSFGQSVSNFYRDMARRRAKLPKVSKMAIKMKDKKSVPSLKPKANKSKSNRNSIKASIVDNSCSHVIKQNNEMQRQINNCSDSSSDSLSGEDEAAAGGAGGGGLDSSTGSDTKVLNEKNSNQLNGKKEAKKVSNNWSTNMNKKSKTNNNYKSSSSAGQLFIGEPVDPNEPTYCLCAQVSYGQMICCDNHLCPIEWFHFPCVDLGHKPKGKWFCPNCRKGDKHNVPKRQFQNN